MRLWKHNSFIDDPWVRLELDQEANEAEKQIVPLQVYLQKPSKQRVNWGVWFAVDDKLETLADNDDIKLKDIPVIALDFPSFANGVSYSKAQSLRQHYGYEGEIRATGEVLPDQIPLMLRVGFNALEVNHPIAIDRLSNGLPYSVTNYLQNTGVVSDEMSAGRFSWRRTARS